MKKSLTLALALVTLVVFTTQGQGAPPPWVRNPPNSNKVTVGDPADQVGIGTSAPADKVHIKGGNLRLEGGDLICAQGGCVGGATLKNNDVSGDKLKDGDVKGAKLKDDDVPGSKLKDNDVSGTKLKDGTIPATKLSGCAVGEILKMTATGWGCVGIGPVTLAPGSGLTVGGAGLSLKSCSGGRILKITTNGIWDCALDNQGTGSVILAPGSGLTGSGSTAASALSLKSCPGGQILKSSPAGTWDCAPDNIGIGSVTLGPGSGLVILPSGTGGKLSLLQCAEGEILKRGPAGGAWMCAQEGTSQRVAAPIPPQMGLEKDKQQAKRIDELQQRLERQTKRIDELQQRLDRLEKVAVKPGGVGVR